MKAMILAAGLGERARPLSLVRPKPLFPVRNRPLLDYALEKLGKCGARTVVVNTFHLAEQVEQYLTQGHQGLTIQISREEQLLGTGGGLKKAAPFLGPDPFIVFNADIMTDIDLHRVWTEHQADNRIATLVLHDLPALARVDIDPLGRIVGFRDYRLPASRPVRRLAFTGIHVVGPRVLTWLPDGPSDIIDAYIALLRQGWTIRAWVAENPFWRDAGTLADYLDLHAALESENGGSPLLGPGVKVSPQASVQGWACLGQDCVVEQGATVVNSILWPKAHIAAGVTINNCVVADGVRVERDAQDTALV